MSNSYQFDLSHLDPNRTYTFHKRGRSYPIHRHTPATLAAAVGGSKRLQAAHHRITHYVKGVATSPSDGVVIQAVRTPVAVDGAGHVHPEHRGHRYAGHPGRPSAGGLHRR